MLNKRNIFFNFSS